MKKLIYTFLAALMVSCSCGQLEVKSPDTQNKLAFQLSKEGQLTYTIDKGQESIIIPSAMGYILKDGTKLDGDFKLLSTATDTFSEEWQTIWGEDETVLNHYNELTLNLEHKPSGIKLNIIARAFNDGVAFRYVIPKQDKLGEYVIMDELTEFNFPGDYKTWWGYADYDNYEKTVYNSPISEIGNIEKYARRKDKEEMERRSLTPMTVEVNDNLAVSIHEAHLVDYPDMSIERMGDGIVLKSHLTPWMNGDAVRVSGEMVSPWRTFTMGTAAQLVESKMLVNLNPPCAYEDTDWIKTFKYIGIWWELHIGKTSWAEKVLFGQPLPKNRPHGATTENAKMHIDFAAKHGFEEVLVEGWDKGWDDMTGSWTGYGIFDWKTPTDDYDLVEVCRYAKEKGVRIMMYVETISDIDHLEPAMDDLFKMYQDLGITTVKMGYTGDVNYDYETKKYRQHHHG
ncbi:MAG: glycoside hydrolase family 97 N-terminal domain-containing protein, partial [Rikenellaceae bacterium]